MGFDESADKYIVGTGTFTGASTGNLSITTGTLVANVEGAVTGNATTATCLQTARNIGGVSFDGSANINLPGVNTAGNQNTSGNAATATAWATARTLCICGDATGSASIDGSGNVNLTVAVVDDSHNHTVANVDGLATCLSGKAATNGSNANDFNANCLYADVKVCTPIACGSTCVVGPIVCGTTCAISPVVCGVCLKAENCVHSGIFCVTICITGAPYIAQVCGCATACFKSPIICGTTCVVAPDINATSDCRCKDNITTVENAYCKIGQIRGVNYNWKDSGKYTLGVVAQEVEEVLPELVTEDDEGFKSVNYNGLVGVLIETVKCLQDKVEELENGSKG